MQYDCTKHTTHRNLIELVDQYLLTEYYSDFTKWDSARLKSLSTNGALSWLKVPYNNIFGRQFTNQEMIILKSLVLGAKIVTTNSKCNLCGKDLDLYGHHALSCTHKGLMTGRHDAICDKIFYYCKKAKMEVEQEKRYEDDGNGGKQRIQGRPGDLKIINFFTTSKLPDGCTHRNLYVDATVVNIYADTYIGKASVKRGVMAQEKEKHKSKKYQNNPNIMGIGIEVMGTISKNGKTVINHIANRLSLLQDIPQSIWINRIRSNILAVLMQHNAQMIIKCYNL